MKKTGVVKSLNVSPKGFYEGMLVEVGKQVIQINFPKDMGREWSDAFQAQKEVSLEVEPEPTHGKAEHEVFRLVDRLGRQSFSGRVERLNYALHGEVNGGILESGDFLHLKPEGAAALGIRIGMAVEGEGERKPMAGGGSVIEAEQVNGIAIEHHKAKKHGK